MTQGRMFLRLEGRGIYSFTARQRWAMCLGLYGLGAGIHPESVTAAWYAADCPPELDERAAGIPFRVRVQWRVSRLLRGW
jgi:hypothetical protein